jgi:hypothetical protein
MNGGDQATQRCAWNDLRLGADHGAIRAANAIGWRVRRRKEMEKKKGKRRSGREVYV